MICTKKELAFYISADRIMNGYPQKRTPMAFLKESFVLGGADVIIIRYLRHLRKYAYYYNTSNQSLWHKIMMAYEHYRLSLLAIRTGFSIGQNSLGYGVVIPHYGTIVVNGEARIGPFSVLHTSTCIAGGGKTIGESFYLSTGSQVIGEICLGNNVTVSAHSLINRSFGNNVLLAGCPAEVKKSSYDSWFLRDGARYVDRDELVLKLKHEMSI